MGKLLCSKRSICQLYNCVFKVNEVVLAEGKKGNVPLNDPVKKSFVTKSSAALTLWIIKGVSDGQASSDAKRPACQLSGGRPEAVREHRITHLHSDQQTSLAISAFFGCEWDMNQKFDISGLT